MNTTFLLMAQYNAQAVIPIDTVVKDYFPHLNTENFVRKVAIGDINIPVVRMEGKSQKTAHAPETTLHTIARRRERRWRSDVDFEIMVPGVPMAAQLRRCKSVRRLRSRRCRPIP